jgi:putative ABC transport system permease protein
MGWLNRIRSVVRPSQPERDPNEELQHHIELKTQENIEAGMSPEEARHAALRAFGGVEQKKEICRDADRLRWLEDLIQDFRLGLRQLRRNPGFAIVVALTLALAIGANAAMFSLVDVVMFRMLPVEKPGELFQLKYGFPGSGGEATEFTNPMWEQVHDHQNLFSGSFAWSNTDELDLTEGGSMRVVTGIWASGSFFSTLGLRPAAGRLIADSDDWRGCPAVAVLGYGFWQGHYGAAEGAIGSTLSLNGYPVEVIGVAPRGFFGMGVGERFDVALPICATQIIYRSQSRLVSCNVWWLNVGVRIRPGAGEAQRAAGLKALSPSVFTATLPPNSTPEEQHAYSQIRLSAVPVGSGTSSLRGQFGEPLEILMAVAGLVLLIVCGHIASLMLARCASRRREIVVRQLLTEDVLLSSAGALLGVLFARWSAMLLVHMISTRQNEVVVNLPIDNRTVGFVLAITVLTTMLFGLLPARLSARVPLISAMKGTESSQTGPWSHLKGRDWIVGSQVALSLVLLVAAGLLLRSFVKLVTLNIGFDPRNVLLVDANLRAAKVQPNRWLANYEEIENRLRALPGVVSIGRSFCPPLKIFGNGMVREFGDHTRWSKWVPSGNAFVYSNYVSPGYLPTLRMPLLAGRNFDSADMQRKDVAMVNQTFARKFFPGLNPIGLTYLAGWPFRQIEVVGLVEDPKFESLREKAHPATFLPLGQVPPVFGEEETFELRTVIPPSRLISPVRTAIAALNKAISLQFETLAEGVNDSLVQQRVLALLSGFFGALALLLAMAGLYGTFSYLVTQRTTEFGIRAALGAQRRDVLGLVIRQGLKLTLVGVAVGIAGALALTRFLSSLLYGVKPTDPLTFIAVSLVLTGVALLACYIPARRATKVDPMVALRYE